MEISIGCLSSYFLNRGNFMGIQRSTKTLFLFSLVSTKYVELHKQQYTPLILRRLEVFSVVSNGKHVVVYNKHHTFLYFINAGQACFLWTCLVCQNIFWAKIFFCPTVPPAGWKHVHTLFLHTSMHETHCTAQPTCV